MTNKRNVLFGFVLAVVVLSVIGASIDYRALNPNQFSTNGIVSIKSGATLTNITLSGGNLNGATNYNSSNLVGTVWGGISNAATGGTALIIAPSGPVNINASGVTTSTNALTLDAYLGMGTEKELRLAWSGYTAPMGYIGNAYFKSAADSYMTFGVLGNGTVAERARLDGYGRLALDSKFAATTLQVNGDASVNGGITISDVSHKSLIYAIGASITYAGHYLTNLSTLIGSNYTVVNVGVSGNTTADMLSRIQTNVFNWKNASWLIVEGGINDVVQSVSAATIEANLQTMFNLAYSNYVGVIALNITPFGTQASWTGTKEGVRQSVNTWMSGTASNINYKINADLLLRDPGNITNLLAAYDDGDGLHWSVAGHGVVATNINSVVNFTTVSNATRTLNVVGDVDVKGSVYATNLYLPTSTNSQAVGVIFKGPDRFIHNYADALSLAGNTFLGVMSGNFTFGTGGGATYLGSFNTGVGRSSLPSLTTGYENVAIGYQSMFADTTGNNNVASGYQSLRSMTTGVGNSGIGSQVLYSTTSGGNNTGLGAYALFVNNTGSRNVALGYAAGQYETGSDAFYIGNRDYVNTTLEKAGSLLYGTFNATPANQTLNINASVGIAQSLSATNGFASYRSNLLAAATITVGASPFNWTNTFGVDVDVYADGVSVTGTQSINGGVVYNTIGQNHVHLHPNEWTTLTYTIGTPTAKWKP